MDRSPPLRMRILVLNTDYPEFLSWLYQAHPGLAERPYDAQLRARTESLFGVSDYYSRNLNRLGHEAWEVHANNVPLQSAWAREHGLRPGAPWERTWRLRRGIVPWPDRRLRAAWLEAVLKAQVAHYRPDVLLNQDMEMIRPDMLGRCRGCARLLVGQHASPPIALDDSFRAYDLAISSFPPTVERFRRLGIPAFLNRMAFEPEVLPSIHEDGPAHAVVFIGSFCEMHSSRREFLERLAGWIPELEIWAPSASGIPEGSPLRRAYRGQAWGRQALGILRRARITLNHHGDVAPHANNMRLYEATAMGSLLVTDDKPDLAELFEPGKEVVAYRDVEGCAEKVRHFLAYEEERSAIAAAGQARTLREHTYAHRMREFSDLLKRLAPAGASR